MDLNLAKKIYELAYIVSNEKTKQFLTKLNLEIIPLIGLPGSGKTISLQHFKKEHGFQCIDTGELFRNDFIKLFPTYDIVKPYLYIKHSLDAKQELLPDELVTPILYKYLKQAIEKEQVNPNKPIYLNSLRSKEQAQAMNEIANMPLAFYFKITEEISNYRQLLREEKHPRNELYSPEQRIQIYNTYAPNVFDYFAEHNIPITIIDNSHCKTKEEGLELVLDAFKKNNLL